MPDEKRECRRKRKEKKRGKRRNGEMFGIK
jgi:hypothetical protein